MSTPTKTIRVLTRADRCDRCSAAATVALQLKSGELMFCGHHYTQHHPVLLTSGAIIVGQAGEES
ncbi:hypothetical protein HWB99_gp053 [Mycobacterium phage DrLupo]|uniref:DUF7455 domain-containing protein n=1 Tax=Mycobacterium phage DrLupo TaxID=2499037 RepID=A0A3S9UQL1_9CAUD|nr:hypothetical protein HWB99_gp053 [Mycobacterium phage DrLupo]AZS12589.1 hypothetical protein SEA_DRLUPO_53 [Mycobacterium phage DrLupo]